MKLIMAVSADGFVAASETDDMSWTGPIDKAVFKLLTSTSDVLAVSAKSLQSMPKSLPGRGRIYGLSTDPLVGVTLEALAPVAPDAWLLGGQELALYALKNGFVSKAYICVSPAYIASPENEGTRIEDKLQPYFSRRLKSPGRGSWWENSLKINFGDLRVDVWDRESAVGEK